jgi:hypothetical protein
MHTTHGSEDDMDVYLAGTGETRDLELTLLTLALIFALSALLSWGIPRFRDYLHRRREARLFREQEDASASEDDPPVERGDWHSVPTR